jgi:hypothetical protein
LYSTNGLPSGNAVGNTLYWNGTSWINNGNIFNNGGNVGVGNNAPLAKLDVVGNIKIKDGTEGAGRVLTSDANGLASWSVVGKGGMVGFISLFDEFGFPMENRSGVLVTLISGGIEKTFLTDQQGKFTASDLTQGSYDIRFEKSGFGTEKKFGIPIASGVQPYILSDISLFQLTTTSILIFETNLEELVYPGSGYFQINVSITLDPFATKRRSFLVFASTLSSVSDKNYRFFKKMSINSASGLNNELLFDREFTSRFDSGTKLYFVAYPVSTGQEGNFDPIFGLKTFSTIGIPTSVKSITIP